MESAPQVLSILSDTTRPLSHREAAGSLLPGITGKLCCCSRCPRLSNLTWAFLHTNFQHEESTVNLLTQACTKQKEPKDDLAASCPSEPVLLQQPLSKVLQTGPAESSHSGFGEPQVGCTLKYP